MWASGLASPVLSAGCVRSVCLHTRALTHAPTLARRHRRGLLLGHAQHSPREQAVVAESARVSHPGAPRAMPRVGKAGVDHGASAPQHTPCLDSLEASTPDEAFSVERRAKAFASPSLCCRTSRRRTRRTGTRKAGGWSRMPTLPPMCLQYASSRYTRPTPLWRAARMPKTRKPNQRHMGSRTPLRTRKKRTTTSDGTRGVGRSWCAVLLARRFCSFPGTKRRRQAVSS